MRHDRRQLLRAIGVGSSSVFVAGCSALTGDSDADGDDGTRSGNESGTETGDDEDENESESEGEGEGEEAEDVEFSATTVITMEAGGTDIWNAADQGHFYYETVSGDFDVSVEVMSLENTNPHAKAGIMARESIDTDAKNVMIRKRPAYGTSPQWRPETRADTTSTTSEDGAELSAVEGGDLAEAPWQRLERTDGTLRAYGSADGEDWTLLAEIPPSVLDLSDEVLLGLAATSHDQLNPTTAKFRNLEGLEPGTNEDISEPVEPGSVSISESAIVSTLEPADVAASSARLRAEVEALGNVDEVDVRFQYREVTEDEWLETESETVSDTGELELEVSGLTGRRYYQFRAVADDGENEVATVNDLFATPSGSGGSSEEDAGPESNSRFDPDDGFSELAPWLDDDTPIVTVSEPTREALATATGVDGPRVVAFETSGTIDLGAEDLNVRNDECWIAGQTAPSPGITLIRGGLWLYGNDCVVQHVRVRPGDAGQGTGWQPDAIEMADDTENNIVDHCTGTWSVDENINVGYDTTDCTISNCLVAEPLNDATHEKGPHGYNSIVGDGATNVSLMGNVWALGTDRNPRLKSGTETVVVNNFVHHFGDGMWADPDTSHSIVGNVFEDAQTEQPHVVMKDGSGATVYAEDNVGDGDNQIVDDAISLVDSPPLWPEALEPMAAGEVRGHNLENAGARPADRTAHDERIVDHVRNGGGGVIDSQDDVGGYPDLEENTRELDEPERGLRAWLRERALAVETSE
ncbi:pectate lyase [Halomontanus rarus]|uniref:pectate lyase n=1 Tax=Halomontanus rarus TaxID=3034020 RepID=UPI0023E78940|nr:pectate lyase [Halovivax sp. TS33]